MRVCNVESVEMIRSDEAMEGAVQMFRVELESIGWVEPKNQAPGTRPAFGSPLQTTFCFW